MKYNKKTYTGFISPPNLGDFGNENNILEVDVFKGELQIC